MLAFDESLSRFVVVVLHLVVTSDCRVVAVSRRVSTLLSGEVGQKVCPSAASHVAEECCCLVFGEAQDAASELGT